MKPSALAFGATLQLECRRPAARVLTSRDGRAEANPKIGNLKGYPGTEMSRPEALRALGHDMSPQASWRRRSSADEAVCESCAVAAKSCISRFQGSQSSVLSATTFRLPSNSCFSRWNTLSRLSIWLPAHASNSDGRVLVVTASHLQQT